MEVKKLFQSLAIWTDVPVTEIDVLLNAAEELFFEPETSVTRQYHPARYVYLLYSGSVCYYMQLDNSGEQMMVGESDIQWTAIGWSGLRAPYRYAVSTQCVQACKVLRWDRARLEMLLQRFPRMGYRFLGLVLQTGVNILTQSRDLLVKVAKQFSPFWQPVEAGEIAQFKIEAMSIFQWLQRSSFFEGFDEESLHYLARHATIRTYQGGEQLTPSSGEDGLYMLVSGAVGLYFSPITNMKSTKSQGMCFIRTLDHDGQIVAWSSALAPRDRGLTAVMLQNTILCFIAKKDIDVYVRQRPEFGLSLNSRLLFLIGNQLRSTRAQLIQQQFEDECFTVRSLLQQVSPQLSVSSLLHNIPHLLACRLTQEEAFRCLDSLKSNGDELEKNLAGICLDLLAETRRERRFYKALLQVYEKVVAAPQEVTPEQVRRECDLLVANAFQQVNYVIEGLENLPGEAGNIFILNHLVSHPYNALPNHFELAMDTHFVSAMVLRPKYGDGGVRVVRRPRNEEFGHQDYYNRLGYIYVVTRESEQSLENQTGKGGQLETFLAAAQDVLQSKNNLVICPEGTSLWSEASPGPLKPGAFVLAGSLRPEPLIVPIAVANFDKRLRNRTLAVLVKPPFRISESVDVNQREDLAGFLQDYRKIYQGYVREAQYLAEAGDGCPAR